MNTVLGYIFKHFNPIKTLNLNLFWIQKFTEYVQFLYYYLKATGQLSRGLNPKYANNYNLIIYSLSIEYNSFEDMKPKLENIIKLFS